ncbi:MAG TPA: immunoglobulin domain-containing protein [Candidatus Acidoferrum sp.]|nr:immunoglobulin domain-containing protein [Candidatus Acidoferrum sp.]
MGNPSDVPAIVTQPTAVSVSSGQTATFSVSASGTAPLSYQWRKNASNVSGATASSYTTPATTTSDSGSTFSVVVSNSAGSATSSAATLTVNAAATAPSITTQPASAAVTAGQTATFSVSASGTAPLSYQWLKNGSNISGATASSYTTPATTTSDSGSTFSVVVSNSAGSATSSAATLTVDLGIQKTYSTTFTLTENPIFESGNWVNGGTTGLDWSNVQTTGGVKAWGTQVPSGPGFNDSVAILTGTWETNQLVQATTLFQPSATNEVELWLHGSISAHNTTGYEITCSLGYAGIAKWLGPLNSFTSLAFNNGVRCSNGSILKATATTIGSAVTLTVYVNGVQVIQVTDSSGAYTGGAPGVGFWIGTGGNNNDAGLAGFSAQDNFTASPNISSTMQASLEQSAAISATRTIAVSTDTDQAVSPTITRQPTSMLAVTGSAATFSVLAGGTAPLSYQWRKNGSNIAGATAASYTARPITATDNASVFDVVITNSAGSVTSHAATLALSSGTQKTYSTTFPTSENFISEKDNWINGAAIGLDWANVQTFSGLAFGTQSGSFEDSEAVLAGNWSPDQMAQATVHTINQNGNIYEEVGLLVRSTITEHSATGYKFSFRCTSDGSQYVRIIRWNGPLGNWTELGSQIGPGLQNGDVVKASVIGNTLTAYINGKAILSVTDNTLYRGSPGIAFYNQGGTLVNNSDFGFTNFYAADHIGTNKEFLKNTN